MNDSLVGIVADAQGRDIEVHADPSGAVRLALGLSELMLDAPAWNALVRFGSDALDVIPPDDAQQVEIPRNTWLIWLSNRKLRDAYEKVWRKADAKLRELAGDAAILTVDGQPVARRITGKVNGASWTKDYLRVIGQVHVDGD